MSTPYRILTVTDDDIPAITQLVNSAYHGQPGSRGWTSESHLVAGQRTAEDTVRNLLQQPSKTMLKCINEQQNIIGCVLLEKKKDTLYLGMLSVNPQVQASGIGKLLLHHAESFARDHQYNTITITVINIRHELVEWYKRRGYVPTGKVELFSNPSYSLLADFSFMEMQKGL